MAVTIKKIMGPYGKDGEEILAYLCTKGKERVVYAHGPYDYIYNILNVIERTLDSGNALREASNRKSKK